MDRENQQSLRRLPADKEIRLCGRRFDCFVFSTNSLCRWDTRKIQTFEIDLRGKEGVYSYTA